MSEISRKIRAAAAAHDYNLYNYDKLFAQQPSLLNDEINPYGIMFFEDPKWGGDAPVIAVFDGIAWCCEFYDPWNATDQMYISEQAQQLGLISASIDVWAGA